MSKPRIFSGMRPTGKLHLGNLLGALDNWVRLQDDYECVFAVVDWHALTTGYEDTDEIRENTENLVIDYLSAGIDPEKSLIIKQSDVKQHAELSLLLSMITPLSWLERCPTYKEQLRELEGKEIMTYGFLGYPVLMAADILVYKAQVVPVGEDQLPHLELTREIVRRFNHLYKPILPEPQARLNDVVLLPGTDGKKMSKSYKNIIEISATPDEINSIVSGMVTDPRRARRNDPGNPEVCPVYAFHRVFSKPHLEDIRVGCSEAGIGCVECKQKLAETLNEYLEPIRQRREAILKKPGFVREILEQGAKRAGIIAEATLEEIRQAMKI
ncbi:MAG: tryptophan--tRNA ligase [Firmicutes bacterium]|jgi:tryptophanyl-tRNA synthetase|nr:tryptophan--tRNA ligase [Bacillota bacterium]